MLIIPLLATISFLTHVAVFVFAAPIPLNDVALKARALSSDEEPLTPTPGVTGERRRRNSAPAGTFTWIMPWYFDSTNVFKLTAIPSLYDKSEHNEPPLPGTLAWVISRHFDLTLEYFEIYRVS